MGQQINYYMGYSDFLHIAQLAFNSGCVLLKRANGKIVQGDSIRIVTPDTNRYYFYFPEAGKLKIKVRNKEEHFDNLYSSGNAVIEASYSVVDHENKRISRARLFSMTGCYDEDGHWNNRPECVKRVYDKLLRAVKKAAPYTEIVDLFVSTSEEDYLKTKEWRHMEYITAELLSLKRDNGYKLSASC